MSYYWINEDIHDKTYLSQIEAYEDDVERNPEYHGCKEYSMAREESAIFEVDYRDLTVEQKEYLQYVFMM